jgi:hypothetical protein
MGAQRIIVWARLKTQCYASASVANNSPSMAYIVSSTISNRETTVGASAAAGLDII